ncbi:uncharacterized protein LOC121504173 isoform X2 [Cheilinus undulatus]|uniref:uncharacterized protein LOC121504173 isoform X2 n=1 Tax=Cheilinus undulatus TaxID=241271 RepID=UPI001BD6DD33|nr:uncharacterized protein LOC121504173 isoform X2 [Cheilinus undulatus]
MFSLDRFSDVVNEQLTAAAEEICDDFTRTVIEDEAEIDHQRRKLDIIWKPPIHLHRKDVMQQHVCKEEEVEPEQQLCHQERKSSLDQEDPEPPQIKKEQLKQEETDTLMLTPTQEEIGNCDALP